LQMAYFAQQGFTALSIVFILLLLTGSFITSMSFLAFENVVYLGKISTEHFIQQVNTSLERFFSSICLVSHKLLLLFNSAITKINEFNSVNQLHLTAIADRSAVSLLVS